MTWPRWLRRAVRNRHRHAIEQASRRWRGGRRGDSGRTRRKFDFRSGVERERGGHLRRPRARRVAGAVLGAARCIGGLAPPGVEVHFIIAACENMVSAEAMRPGDILTASNAKTIEVLNTDAEGRLTLADALLYASEQKPDAVVDLATLTGACVIALGDEMAGLWSNNDGLATALQQAADAGGEGLWRMPLRASYKEGLKSKLADFKNTGPRPGGSITAALFLEHFVGDGIAWAHIDIAGPVWSDKGRGVDPAGATGYGVRTLVNWVCQQAA